MKNRLKGKDVVAKAMRGPVAYNAVYRNMWIAIWSTRDFHAFSWNLHGLTFEKEFRKPFIEIYLETIRSSVEEDQINDATKIRGIHRESIHFPN